jgi:hypothetical protein
MYKRLGQEEITNICTVQKRIETRCIRVRKLLRPYGV